MTAQASTGVVPGTRTASPAPSARRLTFSRALHGEWIKLTTLRSTWWSVATVSVVTIGIALLLAAAVDVEGFSPIDAVALPIQFTVLFAGILGAIAATGEYSTGMIRSTLAANPRRGSVLAVKALVVAIFMFLTSLVMFIVAALAASVLTSARGVPIDWSDPSASILPLVVASLAMSVFAVIGVAFGFILRSGAGAIAATVGLFFVLPIVVNFFSFAGDSWRWVLEAAAFLPAAAAQSAIQAAGAPQDAPGSFIALGLWVAAGLAVAWGVLRTRDA